VNANHIVTREKLEKEKAELVAEKESVKKTHEALEKAEKIRSNMFAHIASQLPTDKAWTNKAKDYEFALRGLQIDPNTAAKMWKSFEDAKKMRLDLDQAKTNAETRKKQWNENAETRKKLFQQLRKLDSASASVDVNFEAFKNGVMTNGPNRNTKKALLNWAREIQGRRADYIKGIEARDKNAGNKTREIQKLRNEIKNLKYTQQSVMRSAGLRST
jgi:vacuolar-type H+-ATPase subunit I/STV1